MKRRKDNLTDLVERLPQAATSEVSNQSSNQQVMNGDGELVTLGQKPEKRRHSDTYGKVNELQKKEIQDLVRTAVEKEIDRAATKIVDKVEKMLKEKGFI